MTTGQAWSFIVPVILLGFIGGIIGEAAGLGKYEELPDRDLESQRAALCVSIQKPF